MRLYLSTSQIPELTGLPRNMRLKFVSFAIVAMKSDRRLTPFLPVLLAILGGIAAVFGGLFLAPLFLPTGSVVSSAAPTSIDMISSLAGAASGAAVGGFVGQQILFSRMRPYLRKLLSS